jgi:hypothetical protein
MLVGAGAGAGASLVAGFQEMPEGRPESPFGLSYLSIGLAQNTGQFGLTRNIRVATFWVGLNPVESSLRPLATGRHLTKVKRETVMNMLPSAEPFRPHPNFDDAINRAICQIGD